MKIILISGKAEAGKTTTANIIKDALEKKDQSACIVPYGQYVKDTARMLFNWDGKKDKAGRSLLQYWGTDVVRKKDPNFWVMASIDLANVIKDEFDYMIVDDCRFPNEIDLWKCLTAYPVLTIRVIRPGHENMLTLEQRLHPSEISLDKYSFDIYLSATNKDELLGEVERKLSGKLW